MLLELSRDQRCWQRSRFQRDKLLGNVAEQDLGGTRSSRGEHNPNLGVYNNPATGGDASDWVRTLVGDSYGSGYSGHTATVSATDLVEDSVLGYKLTTAGLAATQTVGLA